MTEPNESRLTTFGSYKAFYDIECVDEKQKLWRGKPFIEDGLKRPGMPAAPIAVWIYFSRDYDTRENKNDWDLLYHEYRVDDIELFGVALLIVPKEKLLFGYEPESKIIARPRIKG